MDRRRSCATRRVRTFQLERLERRLANCLLPLARSSTTFARRRLVEHRQAAKRRRRREKLLSASRAAHLAFCEKKLIKRFQICAQRMQILLLNNMINADVKLK